MIRKWWIKWRILQSDSKPINFQVIPLSIVWNFEILKHLFRSYIFRTSSEHLPNIFPNIYFRTFLERFRLSIFEFKSDMRLTPYSVDHVIIRRSSVFSIALILMKKVNYFVLFAELTKWNDILFGLRRS